MKPSDKFFLLSQLWAMTGIIAGGWIPLVPMAVSFAAYFFVQRSE
jgi:hypothetical protein